MCKDREKRAETELWASNFLVASTEYPLKRVQLLDDARNVRDWNFKVAPGDLDELSQVFQAFERTWEEVTLTAPDDDKYFHLL